MGVAWLPSRAVSLSGRPHGGERTAREVSGSARQILSCRHSLSDEPYVVFLYLSLAAQISTSGKRERLWEF